MTAPISALKTPKYLAIAAQLREQIEQGELQPGARLPSFVEMRAQYDVTLSTVERIYAVLEKEKLIVREHGRGTFVLETQERKATGVIGIYGVEFSIQPHPYWAHVMEGLQQTASENDIELLMLNPDSKIKWEKVDGIITHKSNTTASERFLSNLPPGMPCVAALVPVRDVVSVVADEYQGAYDLAQHLIGLGHTRIAYFHDPLSQRRLQAYRDAMGHASLSPDEEWIQPLQLKAELGPDFVQTQQGSRYPWPQDEWRGPGDPNSKVRNDDYVRAGYATMCDSLKNGWLDHGCTAIMAQNDDTAIGIIYALQQAGLNIPEQMSVTGFDGTEISRYFSPSLTSIEVPLRKIGITAMNALLDQINGKPTEVATLMLPTQVREGRSTQAPSVK